MVPQAVTNRIEGYLATVEGAVPARVSGVYGVGALALGDFSDRQSNIDLVVVADPRLDPSEMGRVAGAARGLRRAGRDAEVWHVTWADLDISGPGGTGGGETAGSPGSAGLPESAVSAGSARPTGSAGSVGANPLATPMTRAILRHDPMALFGPDWPVVGYDPSVFREWSVSRLRALVASSHGLLVLRRAVVPLVLEAARLTQAAITGRVVSKSEAGELAMSIVSSRHKRLLTDAVGYRHGAHASMYWGPFERKYDALTLLRDLLEAATADEH